MIILKYHSRYLDTPVHFPLTSPSLLASWTLLCSYFFTLHSPLQQGSNTQSVQDLWMYHTPFHTVSAVTSPFCVTVKVGWTRSREHLYSECGVFFFAGMWVTRVLQIGNSSALTSALALLFQRRRSSTRPQLERSLLPLKIVNKS